MLAATTSAGAPATPDAEEARRAARDELSRAVYEDQPSLWERLWQWVESHLDPTAAVPGVPPWLSAAIVVVVAAVLVWLLVSVLRHVTMTYRTRAPETSLFTDDRDAKALAQAADEAAADADYATAVVERFRAIIRSLDETGVIEDYPGMTATEAARTAGAALGASTRKEAKEGRDVVAHLHEGARLFNAVLYGELVSSPKEDARMRELAREVSDLVHGAPVTLLTLLTGSGARS